MDQQKFLELLQSIQIRASKLRCPPRLSLLTSE
jgi:hypothetical protein